MYAAQHLSYSITCAVPVLLPRADGGLDAERAERQKVKDEEAAKDKRNFEWLTEVRKAGYRKVGNLLLQISPMSQQGLCNVLM